MTLVNSKFKKKIIQIIKKKYEKKTKNKNKLKISYLEGKKVYLRPF